MGILPEKTINKKIEYDPGEYIKVVRHDITIGDTGITAIRNIVEHPDSVSLLPILGDNVFLIRQYRKAIEDIFIEIPGGLKKLEENNVDAVIREVAEEIKLNVRNIRQIGVVHGMIGFTSSKSYVFTGEPFEKCEMEGDIDENIEVFKVSIKEALNMIASGKITDARTQIALLKYANENNIKFV